MNTFRERIEPTVEEKHEPQPLPVGERENPDIQSLKDAPTPEELNLDVWEGEHRRKYAVDYFGIPNISHVFPLKMQTTEIDKFIKSELNKLGYEKNIDNYKYLLSQIENKIGSGRLETFKRLQKLSSYIRLINRQSRLNQLKSQYELFKNN